MSSKKPLDVPQVVKKYIEKYPYLDRDLLRKLIRLEHKIENPSELKKLDRYLKKAFQGKPQEKPSSKEVDIPPIAKIPKELWRQYELDVKILTRLRGLLPKGDKYLKQKEEEFQLLYGKYLDS